MFVSLRCIVLASALGAVLTSGCRRERFSLAELDACPGVDIDGRRVVVRLEETAMHDIAFRIGCGGLSWIAVLDQGRRSDREQQIGGVSAVELTPPWNHGGITLAGSVEPMPHREATHSWNLTDAQNDILAARGGFIRLTEIVAAGR